MDEVESQLREDLINQTRISREYILKYDELVSLLHQALVQPTIYESVKVMAKISAKIEDNDKWREIPTPPKNPSEED